MTEQIYYSFWGSESEEHREYFKQISLIADWIGYALVGPRTNPFTGEYMPLSKIVVLQTKEKFGSPRVYVQFSEENFLEDAKHYRQTYKTAFELWPQYERSIREGMDHAEYLFETEEEIADHIAEQMKWLKEGRVNGHIDNDFYFERLSQIEEESIFLKKVCDLT
jgi:hypothetical protein